MVALSPAAFLDRDGVLLENRQVEGGKPYAIRNIGEYRLLPGVPAAVQTLKNLGLTVVVVTNQPDIGAGAASQEAVDTIHQRLRQDLPVDAIYCCPHRQDAGCSCRKPQPGMLHRAATDLNIDLSQSVMIGDRASDMLAGRRAGCGRVFFIDRNYGEPPSQDHDAAFASLPEAVGFLQNETAARTEIRANA